MGRTLTGLTEYSCVSLLGAWVAGIFFMLLTTVSLLQLREVLHPRCMAHRVRPQEPQVDVVGVMVKEGIGVQGKRMVWSGVFYGFVMVCWKVAVKVRTRGEDISTTVLKALTQPSGLRSFPIPCFVCSSPPTQAVTLASLFTSTYIHPLLSLPTFQTCYFAPSFQVPFELLIVHVVTLTILESNKNKIGSLLYKAAIAAGCERWLPKKREGIEILQAHIGPKLGEDWEGVFKVRVEGLRTMQMINLKLVKDKISEGDNGRYREVLNR